MVGIKLTFNAVSHLHKVVILLVFHETVEEHALLHGSERINILNISFLHRCWYLILYAGYNQSNKALMASRSSSLRLSSEKSETVYSPSS